MSRIDLTVPDLGSFADVAVIDVLVKPGDVVEVDTPLITLETDKAAMDVPSTSAGKIVEIAVKAGDKVSKGTVIARLEADGAAAGADTGGASAGQANASGTSSANAASSENREAARPESGGDTVRMPGPGASAKDRAAAFAAP